MIDNLKNVAIPGTGIPLSIFAYNWWICLFFIMFLNPLICFLGAINKSRLKKIPFNEKLQLIFKDYIEHLLHPQDWFSFWRLNCRLTSYHSLVTKSRDFDMEDKWTFLVEGQKRGAAVSPFITDLDTIVCKNKNIEGGMGIHFYKNAAHGGDWIIQEKMTNCSWLNAILPSNAPLSTMRIITCSTWSIEKEKGNTAPNATNAKKFIQPLSAVLRLGRANASTDHSSVLFDVDLKTGVIQGGMSNAQWYKLGIKEILSCPWLPPDVRASCNQDKPQDSSFNSPGLASGHAISHPDLPGVVITGQAVPDMDQAVDIVVKTHFEMMPDVPMVGWDVTFTPKGVFLLEVNLSCNFFRGTFDIPSYIATVDQFWLMLEKKERK